MNPVMPVSFYAEMTPNPAVMKFVCERVLLEGGASAGFSSVAEAKTSPLATKLFKFPFVKGIFISANFVSITKAPTVGWEEINSELRDFLRNFINSGKQLVTEIPKQEVYTDSSFKEKTEIHTQHVPPSNETEQKIVEVLDQYIRPAVESDGGLITFKSLVNGIVTVQMRGACSGCPSSTMTLKAGIEALLKRMVPEVTEVIAEAV